MPASESTLHGTVVVLTGASSGIGHASALAFARQGARLVLASRGEPGLDAVVDACRALGAEALAVPTDVSDSAAVRALADAAIARFGRFDVWVNNVGVGVVGLFDLVPMEAHRRVVEANLIGHMNGAHAALGHFRARGRGTLINMISVGGLAAAPYAAAYVATKFGLRGFSQSLRAEVSRLPDVHVCEVYPTFVDTPGLSHGANFTSRRLKPPPPVVDARTVAATVVSLVRRPRASVSVGSVALPARLAHAIAPDLVGRLAMGAMEMSFANADFTPVTDGNLFVPSVGTAIDGGHRVGRPTGLAVAGAIGALATFAWWAWRRAEGR